MTLQHIGSVLKVEIALYTPSLTRVCIGVALDQPMD